MIIRRLVAEDATVYWTTRNQALKEYPDAFTTSQEEGLATPPEKLARRFGGAGSDDFVLGAFADDGKLLGYAGFERDARAKQRHKGKIVGMYVAPAVQGTGLGKRLVAMLIDAARQIPGLEQLWLTVTRSNESARQLYLRAGFISFGIETRALKMGGDYFDKEFMALSLSSLPPPTLRG
jgi:RimJ/RimL family protein N-acetyltransferase